MAGSSPPAFGIARSKATVEDATLEGLLSGDDIGRAGACTRPQAAIEEGPLSGCAVRTKESMPSPCNLSADAPVGIGNP